MVTLLLKHQDLVRERMSDLVRRTIPPSPLQEMCLYHLAGGGKGFRSSLCLFLCEALGADPNQCVPAAIALELAHRTSLIFDDIQDNSPVRNNQPTVWQRYGVGQALNAGLALSSCARISLTELIGATLPHESALRVLYILELAVVGLCEGQYWDLAWQTAPPPCLADYLKMVRGKTGMLMGASCLVAGVLAGVDDPTLDIFGGHLGVLFQCQDDYLGVWGDAEEVGKISNDLSEGKRSLPVVLAHELYPEQDLGDLTALVMRPEVQARTLEFVADRGEKALNALGLMERSVSLNDEASETLRGLVKFTADRSI